MSAVRPAAVAGMFYPGEADELRAAVRGLLGAATGEADEARQVDEAGLTDEVGKAGGVRTRSLRPPDDEGRPLGDSFGDPAALIVKAVIAPHAGYVYSGPTAAAAFQPWFRDAAAIRTVVILGPAHRVAIPGLAAPSVDAFETPLGEVAIDTDLVARIGDLPQVEIDDHAHALEHSLEVELPFLQLLLPQFNIVPLVVGDASPSEVAEVLEALWGSDETRIVISSDLSHFHPYPRAAKLDRETAEEIVALGGPIAWDRACGATPINGLLSSARRRGMTARLVDLRSSGDTAGDRDRVVGYGAFTFSAAA